MFSGPILQVPFSEEMTVRWDLAYRLFTRDRHLWKGESDSRTGQWERQSCSADSWQPQPYWILRGVEIELP